MAKKWFTNGVIEKFIEEADCPEGFHKGRKPVSDETRRKHSNNNGSRKLTEEQKLLKAQKISATKNARTQEEIDAEVEKAKATFTANYGVDSPMKVKEIKDKLKNNFITKYGVDNPAKAEEIKEKIKQTNMEKYGVENVFAAEEVKSKIKETNIEHYGVDNYQKTAEARVIAKKHYIINKEIILEKTKETKKELYGDENYNNQDKARETCLDKYGVEHFAQTEQFHKIAKKQYLVEDQYFDSLPELALFLYAIEHGFEIERNPVKLEFIFEEKLHYYFPDFRINNKLIELKGDHFFKEDKMINPFDKSQNDLYEAKHQCGLKNNVEFWTKKEYQQYIDWFYAQGYKKEDFETKK